MQAESQLGTHDLEIPFGETVDANTGNTLSARRLRVLLISPAGVRGARLEDTLQRIQHFAALTGGQDVVIVFLLNPPLAANFVIAKDLAAQASKSDTSVDGIYAHSMFQVEMVKHAEIPHLSMLLLCKMDGIQQLLQKHITNLSRTIPTPKPFATPLDLLQHCTATQPMSQQTAYILSDLFPSIDELATACSSVTSAPNSSSPSARVAGGSSQATDIGDIGLGMSTQWSDSNAAGKLKTLRDLVGDRECRDIVDFWKEEWTVD